MSNTKVRDLMTESPTAMTPKDSLEALFDVMMEKNIRHMPIVDDDGSLLGLVSHRDLVAAASPESMDVPLSTRKEILEQSSISEIMRDGPETIEADQDISAAGQLMMENKLGCLPVVEGDNLVGILTESDFVRYVTETAD